MKTTKELEKEIEEWKSYESYQYGKKVFRPVSPDKLNELKTKLQTLKDAKKKFAKLIDEIVPYAELDEVRWNDLKKELKQKLEEI